MSQPVDILDQRDPLLQSVSLVRWCSTGLVIFVVFFGWFWMKKSSDNFGDVHPAGGPAYAVSPVHSIPIPQREAPKNPVAYDTQSTVPTAPAKVETTEASLRRRIRMRFRFPTS